MVDRDLDSNPGTQAFVPDFDDDTDEQPVAVEKSVLVEEPSPPDQNPETPSPVVHQDAPGELGTDLHKDLQKDPVADDAPTPATGVPAQSVVVPGRYQYLKWWKLALVILGVWAAAVEVGLSLFYWWFHTIDKTLPVFTVLVYLVVCIVLSVILAMIQGKPLITALSLAVMSAPLASVAAAAPLYGYYFCAHTGHCLLGVIPH